MLCSCCAPHIKALPAHLTSDTPTHLRGICFILHAAPHCQACTLPDDDIGCGCLLIEQYSASAGLAQLCCAVLTSSVCAVNMRDPSCRIMWNSVRMLGTPV